MRALPLTDFRSLIKGKTIFLLIVVFLIGAISNFPAKAFVRYLLPASIIVNGTSGTVWHGSASEGSINKLFLRDIRWSIKPIMLLSGNLSYKISLYPFNGKIDGLVSSNFNGSLTYHDIKGSLSEGTLSELFPYLGIDGEINLNINSLKLVNNLPVMMNGNINIINLKINGLSDQSIGNYLLKFDPTIDSIIGSIESENALIDVAGVIKLETDGSYEITGVVSPNQFTPEKITVLLGFLGTPNNLNQRDFRFEGRL